jgi:hypothetical protein
MTLIWQGTFRAFGKLAFRGFPLSRKEALGVKKFKKSGKLKNFNLASNFLRFRERQFPVLHSAGNVPLPN